MELLHLELLGAPQIHLGKKPLTGFTTTKAQALFIYLAVTQRVHSRDTLASLFWRDMPDAQAKKNLRNTLPNLRALVGPYLEITRHSVAFNRESPYRLDVEVLRDTLGSRQDLSDIRVLRSAIDLYRDDFLAGFHVRDAPEFEEWSLIEREHLRAMVIDGCLGLARQCIEQYDYDLGLVTTKRLLTLDPWRETAHQLRMLLLAYSNQRNAALAQYEACRTVLIEELGVDPMVETTELYEQIKAETLPLPAAMTPSRLQPEAEARLDVRPTVDWTEYPKRLAFYGREAELDQLHQWIVTDAAGLVGIYGIGGQGKTALATEFAWSLANGELPRQSDRDRGSGGFDRILWRSLENAPAFETLLQGVISILSNEQLTRIPPQIDEQLAILFEHLRQQRCLLILDHVEYLLRDRTFRPGYEAYGQLLQQMVHRVHQSCLMVMSREQPAGFDALDTDAAGSRRLHLRGLPVAIGGTLLQAWGLTSPHEAVPALIERYSGHPLALRLLATTVQELFAGDMAVFFADGPLLFDDLRQVLDEQCANLSTLEKEVMLWLAVKSEPMSFQTLWDSLSRPPSRHALLEALRTLQRQSLLEATEGGFGVQNIVTEYLLTYVRKTVRQEGLDVLPQFMHATPGDALLDDS